MLTLLPNSSNREIGKPDRDYRTEFEVQAFLYMRLREMNIDARGEVVVRLKAENGRYEQHRFDIVIFDGATATQIIEVKSGPIKHKNGVENTRQARRYREFGVPVTFIYGMEQAEEFLAALG